MRPVDKPSIPATPATAAALMDAIGGYCSACERPLAPELRLWHPKLGLLRGRSVPGEVWVEALLLCGNCAEASHAAGAGGLLPNRDVTFRIDDSPLAYALESVRDIELDDAGKPLGPPSEILRVIVRGRTPKARATVDRFALNTPYFDAGDNTLQIPRSDRLTLADRRLDMRTAAWNNAVESARRIREAAPPLRASLAENLRKIVGYSGFWFDVGDRALDGAARSGVAG